MTRATARRLAQLGGEIEACRQCPRLVAWREKIGTEKRRAYRNDAYWARPVRGFGDPEARIVIVGLAPGAHGANRTGRMFTGDRSGDFLYGALHRADLASQPTSETRDDGLFLKDVFITAPCRCAPPKNRPLPEELRACRPWFLAEVGALPSAKVFLALGNIAYTSVLTLVNLRPARDGVPAFAHGAEVEIPHPVGASAAKIHKLPATTLLVASYHVSQQNTQTGRLTPTMFDRVVQKARAAANGRLDGL